MVESLGIQISRACLYLVSDTLQHLHSGLPTHIVEVDQKYFLRCVLHAARWHGWVRTCSHIIHLSILPRQRLSFPMLQPLPAPSGEDGTCLSGCPISGDRDGFRVGQLRRTDRTTVRSRSAKGYDRLCICHRRRNSAAITEQICTDLVMLSMQRCSSMRFFVCIESKLSVSLQYETVSPSRRRDRLRTGHSDEYSWECKIQLRQLPRNPRSGTQTRSSRGKDEHLCPGRGCGLDLLSSIGQGKAHCGIQAR